MDPNANLAKQLELVRRIVMRRKGTDPNEVAAWAEELAEHVEDLDEWIRKGGFMPARWTRNREGA